MQLLRKNQILSLQENSHMFLQLKTLKQLITRSSRPGATMGTCKTKAIQADLGIYTFIPEYSDIQA